MLKFLDRHKFGLLGTFLLHFFVLVLANYVVLPEDVVEKELVIQLNFQEEELEEIELKDKHQTQSTDDNSNKAVNESVPSDVKSGDYNEYNREPSEVSKQNFEQQLEEELKALEEQVIQEQRDAGYGYSKQEVNEMLSSKKNKELESIIEQKPRSESAYKGSTNITYKLQDRYDTQLEVPVYLCQYGGVVVVNIAVDRQGKVISTKIDTESSKTKDPCLIQAALKSAKETRFNKKNSASRIQTGSITYRFVEQ